MARPRRCAESIGGDGQQVAAGATLANPLRSVCERRRRRCRRGAARDRRAGGRLGGGRGQRHYRRRRVCVGRLAPRHRRTAAARGAVVDDDGRELQRLDYGAAIAQAGTGGGCDITIGRGGQFERLDGELLARLLEQGRGTVCICFMPGMHEIESLVLTNQTRSARWRSTAAGCLALRGDGRLALSGLTSLELRDLRSHDRRAAWPAIDRGRAALRHGARSARPNRTAAAAGERCNRLRMTGCNVGAGCALRRCSTASRPTATLAATPSTGR